MYYNVLTKNNEDSYWTLQITTRSYIIAKLAIRWYMKRYNIVEMIIKNTD